MKAINLTISLFLVAAAASGQTVQEHLAKANQHLQMGQTEAAELYYRRALEAEPGNLTAKYNLACLYHRSGKNTAQAIELLKQVSQSATDRNLKAMAYYNEGVIHSKARHLPESIESYKNALRINPQDQQARENLQKALLEQKKQQQKQEPKKKNEPKMSQKEAEQKLRQLQQKEKELQKRMQSRNQGSGQAQDW